MTADLGLPPSAEPHNQTFHLAVVVDGAGKGWAVLMTDDASGRHVLWLDAESADKLATGLAQAVPAVRSGLHIPTNGDVPR